MRIGPVVFVAVLAMACGGERGSGPAASPGYDREQWKLPGRIREISGLALDSDDRLFGTTDEEAVIYELDYTNGKLVKAFAFGDPVLKGDFEGIAYLQGRFWLMTSQGDLYAGPEGADGERVSYEEFETGLGDECEFEGLAEVESRNALVLLCKEAKKDGELRAFEWSIADASLSADRGFRLPQEDIEEAIDGKSLNPSGIAMDPRSGNWLVLAARQHALFELDADGNFLGVIMRLGKKRHRQAEGLEVTSDGRLFVADEGQKGKARLAVYHPEPGNKNN